MINLTYLTTGQLKSIIVFKEHDRRISPSVRAKLAAAPQGQSGYGAVL
jgi:hypothetical protein